jgi:glycosyltransferase involved in cell wall biosynthesis
MNPLVSIVIPAYNRAAKLSVAVKSIQAQTYTDWEIIIADDGSQDETEEVVQNLIIADGRIRYVRHQSNRGAQAARNSGIIAARGQWIAFLDSDDEWLPESLELRIRRLLDQGASVVYSGALIQHYGKPLETYHLPEWNGRIYAKVIAREGPMFQSMIVSKEALETIGYLDENIVAYQEWDTSIRLARHFAFAFEPAATFIYDYTCKDSISRDSLRAGRGYEQILAKVFWDALFLCGPSTIAYHYERIANWFKEGGDMAKWRRYHRRAQMWKVISPRDVLGKTRSLLRRNGRSFKIMGNNKTIC